jgi:hypothetical protein
VISRSDVSNGREVKCTESFLLWGVLEDVVDRTSAVSIAIGYRLVGSMIESRWGVIFRASLDRPWGPRSLLYNWNQVSFPD